MSDNPVDSDEWRIAGVFAQAVLTDIYAEAKRKQKLRDTMERIIKTLDEDTITDKKLWNSSIEESL